MRDASWVRNRSLIQVKMLCRILVAAQQMRGGARPGGGRRRLRIDLVGG
jgi:hypothetical protein